MAEGGIPMQLDRSKLKQSLPQVQELLAERIVKALENLDINSRNTTRFGILYPKARLYSDPLRIEFKVEIDDGHSTSVLIGLTIAFGDVVPDALEPRCTFLAAASSLSCFDLVPHCAWRRESHPAIV